MNHPTYQLAQPTRRGEDGMALLLVVGAMVVVGVIAAHLAVLSEVTAQEAKITATRMRLRHIAESAAERALFLHLADRRKYANRSLGQTGVVRLDPEEEAWMADDTPHRLQLDDVSVEVRLRDADSGMNVEGRNPAPALRKALTNPDADEDRQLAVERFLDELGDYTDPDDNIRLHGKETDAYADEGWYTLPRNNAMQLREEIHWIGAGSEVLGASNQPTAATATAVRLIPPKGFSFGNAGKPAFFSASTTLLRNIGNFNDAELEQVMAARQGWLAEQIPLTDSLDPALLARLRGQFSFAESGITTVEAVALDPTGKIRRGVRISRDCRDPALRRRIGGEIIWSNWEHIFP